MGSTPLAFFVSLVLPQQDTHRCLMACLWISTLCLDFNSMLAAHAQAAAAAAAAPAAGNDHSMPHLHRMSSQGSAVHHDSLAAPPMHHPGISTVSSGQLAPRSWD